jgi:hypothetical protein
MANPKASAPTLLDATRERIPKHRGFAPWNERLPADLLAEANAVKAAWARGELGTKTATAIALSHALQARGIKIGRSGVERWLEKP